ncbi:MAG: hypothetical protein ABJH82_08435 [Polaribacter sp.]|uniref:hypothetical protein n=1 Tax=Polaribacter sp. TaxID=1920175 RepID=UPI003266E5BC
MKTNKKNSLLFFLLLFTCSLFFYGQNSLKISLHQDLKLLVTGDNLGNKTGTLDLITRLKHENKQLSYGYFNYGFELERAQIAYGFTRYGAIFGFTFNRIINDSNFHITPLIGLGNIYRKGHNSSSWSGSLEFNYSINKKIKISTLNQITERTDLGHLYTKTVNRYSFFIGLEINLYSFN